MLKPTDVPAPILWSEADLEQQAEIETCIDRALKRAGETNAWPCRPGRTRGFWRLANVTAVLDRYREAGWLVAPGSGDVYAVITHPASKEA